MTQQTSTDFGRQSWPSIGHFLQRHGAGFLSKEGVSIPCVVCLGYKSLDSASAIQTPK